MRLIAHRGNLVGSQPEFENRPDFIDRALAGGFDVEIDLRVVASDFMLGHDAPDHRVSEDWLRERVDRLWVHCKNREALDRLTGSSLNYFWHQKDDYTLTSHGFGWVHPGIVPYSNSVLVLQEDVSDRAKLMRAATEFECFGICSDFVETIERGLAQR